MDQIPVLTFRLLLLSWITAKRQLIHDSTASRTQWNQNYDFIVVGAGAAGCVVSNRLAATGELTVLLLEAGGAQDAIYNDIPPMWQIVTDKRPQQQWIFHTEPQKLAARASPGARILQTAGKTLGGSSTHNDMMFNRGNPRDFDAWEYKYGAKGWNFDAILPFFKRFENNTDTNLIRNSPGWHGTNGPIQITTPEDPGENLLRLLAVYNSLGFKNTDINGPNQTGAGIGQSFVNLHGFRSSASNGYIDPNPYPKSLHIATKALVTKILFNGLTAVGVEFAKNDKPFRVYAQKEVIITAGAVKTPQLLMLSGIGPGEHLEYFGIPVRINLPVGNNYRNHFAIHLYPPFAPPITIDNLEQLYYEKTGILSKVPYAVVFFSTRANTDKQWPNVQIWSRLGENDIIYHVLYLSRVYSHGTIRLQSTSPYIQPLIDPRLLTHPRDYSAAIEGSSFMYYISQHPGIASRVFMPTLNSLGCPSCPGLTDSECTEGLQCLIERHSTNLHHPSGTCRMGDVNRDDVVVDPLLRVKHAKNLRVCDTSIMPDISNGNLYAPSLMIGEKCAQMIKDCYIPIN